MPITLSPAAVARVAFIREKEKLGSKWLRVGVRGGGCSGFSYVLDFVDGPDEKDRTFNFDNGVNVCVDKKSYLLLNGTELDFEEDFIQTRFVWKNPVAQSTCSCGTSFSLG